MEDKLEKCGRCNKTKDVCNCGRPTKYKGEETIRKSEEYIKSCVDKMGKVVESINKKTGRERFVHQMQIKLPKAEGLALYLGVSRDTLYEWASKYDEFSDILERVNQIQADRVINEALAGNYNALIAKLLLAKHGYKDRSDITTDDKPIHFKISKEVADKYDETSSSTSEDSKK